MRKIIEFFIYYTVPLNLIVLAVLIFGIIGMKSMKSTFFPLYDSNIISISLVYPGASPAQVEEGAITKIEKQLRGIKGVDRITSKAYENFGNVIIELENKTPAPEALQEIKNRVDGIMSFPKELENPIISIEEIPDYTMILALTGEHVDLLTLKKIAQNIETDLINKEEISQVFLTGFPEEEIEIAVSEESLRANNLTFQEIAMAVSASNISVTGGTIRSQEEDYSIRVNNKSYHAVDLENLILKSTFQGNILKLKDVATVREQFNSSTNKIDVDGNPAVVITVGCTNNEDFMSIAKVLTEYVSNFNETNNNIYLETLADRSIELQERTNLLVDNGIMSLLLVLLVLGCFLRVRLAFWVAFGLLFSVVGFFAVGNFFHVSINMISLFGMIVVIGLLVDDGIVVAENIFLHVQMGKSRRQAVLDGTMEVLPAIMSGVLTTMIAFGIFFFIGGSVGNYFSEMAIVVIVTLVISLFEAFLILPSHLAHSKTMEPDTKPFIINVWADKLIKFLTDKIYTPVIRYLVAMPHVGVAALAALIIITLGAVKGGVIKQDFFPKIASNTVDVIVTLPEGSSQYVTDSILVMIEKELSATSVDFIEDTAIGNPVQFIERRLGPGTNKGSIRAYMIDDKQRSYTTDDFIAILRNKVGPVPECETLRFESLTNFVGAPIAIALKGNDKEELQKASARLQGLMATDERLVDVADDDLEGLKEIKLTLKPNAYLLHFNYSNVIQQVRSGFYGLDIQRIQRGNDELKVVVRYDENSRSSIKNLDDMWLKSPTGSRVPLSEIAEYTIERGELSISHLDGQKVITVGAGIASPELSDKVVLADIQKNFMPTIISEFPNVGISYEGQSRVTAAISKTGGPATLIAVLFILLSISLTFRTYTKALLFIPVIGMSYIGVVWGHFIMGIDLTMVSFFGLITLIGIQVNDGLVLMQKVNNNIQEKMPFKEALIDACVSRFRPIFLTTITTVAGLLPLMIQASSGSEVVYPIAVSIVYGISFITVITLTILPILLMAHNAIKRFLHWQFTGNWVPAEQVERAYIEMEIVEKLRD